MSWKHILGGLFFFVVFTLLLLYWFIPFGQINFTAPSSGNHNFFLNSSVNDSMQFYPNMRYPDSRISYRISNCTLQKKAEMESAISIIENKTVLQFYPVSSGEEVTITCDSLGYYIEISCLRNICRRGRPGKYYAGRRFQCNNQGKDFALERFAMLCPACPHPRNVPRPRICALKKS